MAKIIIEYDTNEPIESVVETLQRLATVQTMAQIEAGVAKTFHDRIETMSKQIIELNTPKPKGRGLHGKWSRKFEACVKCGQADSPHASKGRCLRCYQKQTKAENTKTIIPLSVPGEHLNFGKPKTK